MGMLRRSESCAIRYSLAAVSIAFFTGTASANNPVTYPYTLPDGRPGAAELTFSEAFTTPPKPPCPAKFQSGYGGYEPEHAASYDPVSHCGGEANCYDPNNWGTNHWHEEEVCTTSDYDVASGCHRPCNKVIWWHRFGHSSFDLNAKILRGDQKTTVAARLVQAGDTLWNPMRGTAVKVRKVVIGFEAEPLLDLVYDGGSLRISQRHPMVLDRTALQASAENSQEVGLQRASLRSNEPAPSEITFGNYVMRQARTMKVGDEVLASDGKFHKLTAVHVRPVRPDQKVVNIELDGPNDSPADHMLLSEGLVTGDYVIQLNINRGDTN